MMTLGWGSRLSHLGQAPNFRMTPWVPDRIVGTHFLIKSACSSFEKSCKELDLRQNHDFWSRLGNGCSRHIKNTTFWVEWPHLSTLDHPTDQGNGSTLDTCQKRCFFSRFSSKSGENLAGVCRCNFPHPGFWVLERVFLFHHHISDRGSKWPTSRGSNRPCRLAAGGF